MNLPTAQELSDIGESVIDRLWRRQPLLFAAPSAILAINTLLDALVAPLHEVFEFLVTILKVALWAVYGIALARAWSRRRPPRLAQGAIAVASALSVFSLAVFGWAGSIMLALLCLTPTLEAVTLTLWPPGRALDVGMTLGMREPVRWAGVVFGCATVVGLLWLIVNGVGSALFSDAFTAFGELLAGLVVGPLLHLFFGLRCALFDRLAEPYFEDVDA